MLINSAAFLGLPRRVLYLPVRVLRLSLQVDLRRVLDDPLHVHLDELVERVQLLADKAWE